MLKIKYTNLQALSALMEPAKRDKVHLHDSKSEQWWFGIYLHSNLIGCYRLMRVSRRKVRFASFYILPEHRGQGYGKKAVAHSVRVAKGLRFSAMDARANSQKRFEAYGFEVLKDHPSDGAQMIRHLK